MLVLFLLSFVYVPFHLVRLMPTVRITIQTNDCKKAKILSKKGLSKTKQQQQKHIKQNAFGEEAFTKDGRPSRNVTNSFRKGGRFSAVEMRGKDTNRPNGT